MTNEKLTMNNGGQMNARNGAIAAARMWLAGEPVFLDTETTGLDGQAEVVEIAIVDTAGDVLFNSLVKPSIPIPAEATAVHGITNAMVRAAPPLRDAWLRLLMIFQDRDLVIYNAGFDTRLLVQSGGFRVDSSRVHCAMKLYSKFYGAWDDRRQSYRWQSLSAAAEQCGLIVPADLHRALADADLTRHLLLYVAESEMEGNEQ